MLTRLRDFERSSSLLNTTGCLALFLSLAAPPTWASFPPVLFVDRNAAGPVHDGSSWCAAYTDLQDALAAAQADPAVREIRIADGSYSPDRETGDRAETFRLVNGVALRGGYAGCGAADSASRDIAAYETILSGDLLGNDGEEFQNYEDNSLHIVTALNLTKSTLLEGLTIRGGNADTGDGGSALSSLDTHLRIQMCKITDNLSSRSRGNYANSQDFRVWSDRAGAVRSQCSTLVECSLAVHDTQFARNASPSTVYGAGLSVNGSVLRMVRTTFTGHKGGAAAGVFATSAQIEDCLFAENERIGMLLEYARDVSLAGTTFHDQGESGLFSTSTDNLVLRDCRFEANQVAGVLLDWGKKATVLQCEFRLNPGVGLQIGRLQFATVLDCDFAYNGGPSVLGYSGAIVWQAFDGIIRDSSFYQNTSDYDGGAIRAQSHDRLQIDRCDFVGNRALRGGAIGHSSGYLRILDSRFDYNWAVGDGGAIASTNVTLDIASSRFLENRAFQGGALATWTANASIHACDFVSNSAYADGGAVYADHSELTLGDSIVRWNSAFGMGGGLNSSEGFTRVAHCTFVRNRATEYGGIYDDGEMAVTHSILWENADSTYSEPGNEDAQVWSGTNLAVEHSIVQGWTGVMGGANNRGDDPQFVHFPNSSSAWNDANDLRLLPTSPAINAGDPDFAAAEGESDLDGHARVLCGRVDIGAYEWGVSDADCDGAIDGEDAAALLGCLSGPDALMTDAACRAFDYFADGAVDLRDFARFEAKTGGDAWTITTGTP